jgi:hypothetical protein
MARIRVLRTYRFLDKDPVIDQMRTVLQDEGLFTRLTIAADIASLSRTTLDNWFHGDTKRPQFASIMALMTSLGYENKWSRTTKIDVDEELKKARDWLIKEGKKKQAKEAKEAKAVAAKRRKRPSALKLVG